MRHEFQRFVHPPAHALTKGDEHPPTLLMGCDTLPFYLRQMSAMAIFGGVGVREGGRCPMFIARSAAAAAGSQ